MFDEKSYSLKMDKAIEVFSKELTSLRTGRANAPMLDLIKVDVYGQQMPINQVGSITTPEPRMINIQVWDQNNVPLVDAAIKKSELGLNPQIDGQLIRLPIPELNEERRRELSKLAAQFAEQSKVAVRNVRKDGMDKIKKLKLKIQIKIQEDELRVDGKKKDVSTDALPEILSEALQVGFDTNVGHDYLEDSEARFDFYNRLEEKVPFDLEMFNKITEGGLSNKTLNIALAGTGVGKSLFMCHMASANIAAGKNVLYLSLIHI